MTRACRVGVQLPEVERPVPWPEMVELARTAEAVGLDSIWLGDHLLYDLPDGTTRGPWEAWTALAALAAVTERVALGPFVASTSFHAPAMLAKQAATVDAISDGRLILGLGAGWNEREYRAFGFPFDHRVSRFEESFTIVRELLRTGRSDVRGRFAAVEDCVLDPAPRPGGPPLMLGSVSPRMLRIGLPHVDLWNVWWSDYRNDVATFAALVERVEQAAADAGRQPGAVGATAAVLVRLPGGTGRLMGDEYDDATVVPVSGSPADIAGHLRGLADVGAVHLQLVLDPITRGSVESLAEVLALFDA